MLDTLQQLYRLLRQFERVHQISPLELFCLLELFRQDGMRIHEFAALVGSKTGSTANVINLEAKGWVYREKDPTTKTGVRIFLSDKALHFRGDLEQLQKDVESVTLKLDRINQRIESGDYI